MSCEEKLEEISKLLARLKRNVELGRQVIERYFKDNKYVIKYLWLLDGIDNIVREIEYIINS